MEILERLQDRIPDTGHVQRIVLFGRETEARYLSGVLVRLPSGHEFPLHTHPISEDCFFVLSGSGEFLEPSGRFPIDAPAGVWIPAGHPHGLRAGSSGMLEVGFQSPADHTAVPFEEALHPHLCSSLVTSSFAASPPPAVSCGQWSSVFPGRTAWRHLDADFTVLASSQSVTIDSGDFEWVIVVVSGEIEIPGPPLRRLPAFSAIRLDPDGSLAMRATASPTLVIAVKAHVNGRTHR